MLVRYIKLEELNSCLTKECRSLHSADKTEMDHDEVSIQHGN